MPSFNIILTRGKFSRTCAFARAGYDECVIHGGGEYKADLILFASQGQLL